jgi:hypothetical protein
MNNLQYFVLDLRKKLVYVKIDISPFTFPKDAEEILIQFEVDEAQGKSFEPNISQLLGHAQQIGIMKKDDSDFIKDAMIELPAGNYFFSQVREILDETGSAELAAEVQKEALWERRKLGSKIYLRYLHEHGSPVTQIFRELLNDAT